MLRMTKLADYGVVLLSEMAGSPNDSFTPADLEKRVGIPKPTISKLLKQMTAGGLLISQRGKHGGYRLSGNPEEVNLAQVLNVLEGPLAVTACSAGPGLCQLEQGCTIRRNWQQINRAIYQGLEQLSLAAMAHPLDSDVTRDAFSGGLES